MIVGWKYRTTFENAYDSFDKISKFQKEAGADWVITSITTGGDMALLLLLLVLKICKLMEKWMICGMRQIVKWMK